MQERSPFDNQKKAEWLSIPRKFHENAGILKPTVPCVCAEWPVILPTTTTAIRVHSGISFQQYFCVKFVSF